MIIIAESGSTKTDWILKKDKDIVLDFQTVGLNPYHIKDWKKIKDELSDFFSSHIKEIDEIFFYGSGCGREDADLIIKKELSEVFIKAEFKIYNDLLAACRATAVNKNEIVVILGTGSNSCLYKEGKIHENIAATGYLFADEGGGVDLGKRLIGKVLREELPSFLINQFYTKYELTYNDLIKKCYSSKIPNRYLASFTPFLLENLQDKNIKELIYNSFLGLFKNQIIKYSDYHKYSISFVGSIAYYFSDILKKVANEYSMNIHLIVKKPIDKLINYHK